MAAYEAEGTEPVPPIIPEDTFAVRLVIVRKALGLTQAEAAERCGLDDGTWSTWENGTRPRGMDKIVETISEKLHVDRDWLMWGGALTSGSFAPELTALPDPTDSPTLFDEDLLPVDHWGRPFLTSV